MKALSNNKGMTLLEVIISFAIIAIVALRFVTALVTVGNLNARADLLENNDASLALDIETTENLKEAGPPTTKQITSNSYTLSIALSTYTTTDGLDSIRTFSYEP
jgi:prepilin-type N-terminal cleavage/methylation domain-containing protein